MRRCLLVFGVLAVFTTRSFASEPDDLQTRLEAFRREIPPAQTTGEMNGFLLEDEAGKSFTMSHLAGVAERLQAKSRAECYILLTYLKDKDLKFRFMAAQALEKVCGCYPGGMSLNDIQEIRSEGHAEMVRRFAAKLAEGPETPDGKEAALVAAGDWSPPVADIRGRLLVYQGRLLGQSQTRETIVYLELQDVSDAVGEPRDLYFDPRHTALTCELRDAAGKVASPGTAGRSGGNPAACWLTLPLHSLVRLPASPYGFGRPPESGLLVPLPDDQWLIPPGETMYLSGTFASRAPENHGRSRVWQGTLTLPKMAIQAKK